MLSFFWFVYAPEKTIWTKLTQHLSLLLCFRFSLLVSFQKFNFQISSFVNISFSVIYHLCSYIRNIWQKQSNIVQHSTHPVVEVVEMYQTGVTKIILSKQFPVFTYSSVGTFQRFQLRFKKQFKNCLKNRSGQRWQLELFYNLYNFIKKVLLDNCVEVYF